MDTQTDICDPGILVLYGIELALVVRSGGSPAGGLEVLLRSILMAQGLCRIFSGAWIDAALSSTPQPFETSICGGVPLGTWFCQLTMSLQFSLGVKFEQGLSILLVIYSPVGRCTADDPK